jgi:hypothetical protein
MAEAVAVMTQDSPRFIGGYDQVLWQASTIGRQACNRASYEVADLQTRTFQNHGHPPSSGAIL